MQPNHQNFQQQVQFQPGMNQNGVNLNSQGEQFPQYFSQMSVIQPQMNPMQMPIPQLGQGFNYQVPLFQPPTTCCTSFTNLPPVVTLIFSLNIFEGLFWLVVSNYVDHPFIDTVLLTCICNIVMAFWVWKPIAEKIERSSSSVRYLLTFLINYLILSVINMEFIGVYKFCLFETLLIARVNTNKTMSFCCCKMRGNSLLVMTVICFFLANCWRFWTVLLTFAYVFVYQKWLIQKLVISDETVLKTEKNCLMKFFSENFASFVTLEEVKEEQERKKQEVNQVTQGQMNMQINMSSASINGHLYPSHVSLAGQGINMIGAQGNQV